MKKKFPGARISRARLYSLYYQGYDIFTRRFGHEPRQNIKKIMSDMWDENHPQTSQEFLDFYRNNVVVAEELAWWLWSNNCRRMSRAIVAGAIAHDLGVKTFSEYGCGLGIDAKALEMQGLSMIWMGDICLPCLDIAQTVWNMSERIVDLYTNDPGALPVADMLFSSDTFEHIADLEAMLLPWIGKYRVVTVYAPFGKREGQHQHTTYPAREFHSFMAHMGYEKIVYNLAVPPFVYVKK